MKKTIQDYLDPDMHAIVVAAETNQNKYTLIKETFAEIFKDLDEATFYDASSGKLKELDIHDGKLQAVKSK